MTNDTPNNLLCSFAIFGGGSCRPMKTICEAVKSGEINLMLDSGAYSAFMSKGYDHVTMDNYCRWLDRFADCAEKYVMLDVIGDEDKTKRNYETMRKRGYNPMYVYTLTAKDNAFCLDAIKANNDICVAGGQMKCDWLIQRYQRVLKMSGGKARIHGLAFVTFPKMLQCGLAFANGVQRLYFGAGRLDTNVKGFSKRVIEEIKSRLEPLYDIVIETSGAGLNAAMQLTDFAYVILRHEVPKISRPQNKNRIWLKVDDGSFIGVAGAAKWNSLRDLDGDLYKTDKEVYK